MEQFSPGTGPDRYGVLHAATETLLDELTRQFIVERRESKEPLPASPDGELVRTVRLIPRTLDAAPLAVAFTEFPGIVLRLGRWYQQALPTCGCDGCAEDPAELVAALRALAGALAEGGLWERVHRKLGASWSEARLIGPGFSGAQEAQLDAADARAARRDGFAAPVQWAPWPLRPEDD